MSMNRSDRVAGLIKQIVGETLMFKVKNPQARKATVHDVTVTGNLRSVKIYIGSAKEDKEKVMQALEQVKGFVRSQIAAEAKLRFTPEIQFVYDHSLEYAENIEKLLRDLNKK